MFAGVNKGIVKQDWTIDAYNFDLTVFYVFFTIHLSLSLRRRLQSLVTCLSQGGKVNEQTEQTQVKM